MVQALLLPRMSNRQHFEITCTLFPVWLCGRAYDSEEAEDVYYDVTNLYYYKDVFYVYIYDYMKSYISLFCSRTVSAPNLMMDGNILHILQYIAHLQPIKQ